MFKLLVILTCLKALTTKLSEAYFNKVQNYF